MRKLAALLTLLAAIAPPGQAAAACITDDAGDRVCVDAPATRIVPLYAAFSDILAAMGLADRIVGRTRADASAPPRALSIGTHMRPSLELVLGLRPQLVLQMGGREEAAQSVAAIRRLGIPTAFFQVRSFADMFSAIDRIGMLAGAEAEAGALVRSLAQRLRALESRMQNAGESLPGVFFEVRYPNLLGAGPDSMVTDIIRAAGGRNVLAEGGTRKGRVVRLSEEELLRLDPEAYCIQSGPMNKNPVPLGDRPHFAGLRAARSGRVLTVDEQLFSRPGPKAVDAAEMLARFLHPGLFPSSQETTRP